MKNFVHSWGRLAAAVCWIAVPTAALAQVPAKPTASGQTVLEEIIVTSTSVQRTGFDTPLSVSALDSVDLARVSASSQADILATLPGIKAEGGGGEVAANVQIRGMPSSGQFQFTPLEYDGMPALSTFGLNSSAFDVYARNDLGIKRLEYVAGGVSNLFGPGSVAGVINYVSKTGGEDLEGILQTEWADEGRLRGDFYVSGPLGSGNYFALSGFYRYDEGPLDSGLPSDGMQLRGNFRHEFDDGRGEFRIVGQYIDDRTQFFLPIPLDGATMKRVSGADGHTVYTANTAQASNLTSILPGGTRYVSNIADGVATSGGMIGAIFEHELGGGFELYANAKWSQYDHEFNLFLDGDGVINVPETQAQYLTNRSITDPGAFTFVDSDQSISASSLLFANRVLNRDRPVSDFSSQIDLRREITAGAVTHKLTLGTWFARGEAEDNNLTQTYLAEFGNAPRLVNLVAGGVNYTRNGLVDPSVGYSRNTHSARRTAFYLADQMETERWAFDIGLRMESMNGNISRERSATFNGISQGGTLESAALTSAVYGTGAYQTGEVSRTEYAVSAGGLYRLSDALNLYANYSRGFFFPEIRGVGFSPLGQPASYEGEIINQAELGMKYAPGRLTMTAAAFWSDLANRRSVQFINTGGGGVGEVVTELSTKAIGLEASGSFRVTDAISFDANVTYTDHEISKAANASLVGNELERKPNLFVNAGVNYDDGRFDAALFWNHQGDAFANNSNTVVLPSYNLVRLNLGYTLATANEQPLRIGLSVFNLFDSEGLAEGSPRVGNNQTAGGQFFVGRPILPRRYTLTATYRF